MKMFLLDQMLRPAVHRIGTAIGGYAAGAGLISSDQQTQVAGASALLLGLMVDFITRRVL